MKSTRFDYINLVLFTVLLTIISTLYTIAYRTSENNGVHTLAAILLSFFALFPCISVTNIWFNYTFNKATIKNNHYFYGRHNFLLEYRNDAGEQFRGAIFFFLTFLVPALITKEWTLVIVFFTIFILFFNGVTTNIKRFNKYLNKYLTPTEDPNSP